jgi:hypothetical protein
LLVISSSNISNKIYFYSENLRIIDFLNFKSSPSPVYVLPDHPPILAFINGSVLPIRSVETPSFNFKSAILISLQAIFLTVKDNIISPKL